MKHRAIILLSALALAWPGSARAGSPTVVRLDAGVLKAAQLHVQVLKPSRQAPRLAAYGIVLDPARVAAASAEIAAARSKVAEDEAKASLAAAAAARTEVLYRARENVALADMQKAQSQLAVARAEEAMETASLAETNARIRAAWGPTLAAAIASNSAPLPELEEGSKRLVRVSLPLGAGLSDPPPIVRASAPDGTRIALAFVSRSPRTERRIAGQSSFYLMARTNSAPIGTPLAASLDTAAPESGVIVPASAVVWNDGQAFVYRQIGATTFAAVPISTATPRAGGYFVPERLLAPGTKVVTEGAALILSAALSGKSPKAVKGDEDRD